MRWPFWLALAATVGLGLPWFADWSSRQRDAVLEGRIQSGPQPPPSWSFSFDGHAYKCTGVIPFVPADPVYVCVRAAPASPTR